MLLVAVSLEAQSLPEAARKERARQAGQSAKRVLSGDKAKESTTTPEKPPAAAGTPAPAAVAKPAEASKAPAAAAPKPAPPKPAEDPVKKYAEEVAKLRSKVVQLQDQETAIQLEINDWKNKFLAPVIDSATRDQAQTKMGQGQTQLTAVQKELADTRRSLQLLEAQGPPKP